MSPRWFWLPAGALALAAGYLGNRLIWKTFHGRGTAWFVPLWEEFVKTGSGCLAGGILPVHVIFGLGEAAHEASRKKFAAGFLAAVSHLLFGLIARAVWARGPSFAGAWLAGAACHGLWNLIILRLARPRGSA